MKTEKIPLQTPWYSLDIPGALSRAVWVALSIVLLLSIFDIIRGNSYRELLSGWVPMKISTSLCFICSVSALLLQSIRFLRPVRFIAVLLALFVGLAGALSLYEHVVQNYTGGESVLGRSEFFMPYLMQGIQMALFTCFSFILISLIFMLKSLGKKGTAHVLNMLVFLIGYFFLITHVFNVQTSSLEWIPLSLNTSIAVIALSIALFMVTPDTWLLHVFTSGSTGGIIARQMLIPLIILPVFIGWLRITGERLEWFSSEVGIVLVALVYTCCFVTLAWLTSRSVNKIDQKRLESDEILAKSRSRFQLLSGIASRLLVTDNPQKIVNELCNEAKDFLECELFFNFLVDENSEILHLNAYAGISEKEASAIKWTENGNVVCGCVARDGERIVAECIQDSADISTALVRGFGIRAYACHPLLSQNKVIGSLSFGTRNRDHFSDEDISLMKIISDQVAIAMGRINNEKALRDSEDRFRTIAESLPVQISITRISDSTVRFTNDAYNATFGFEKGALIGRKATDLYLRPEDRDQLMELLSSNGSVNNFETQVVGSNGIPFWIIASVRQIRFGGEPAWISALMDIDQLKKAQQELLNLNRTLHVLGKSSQAMMHTKTEIQYLQDICKIVIDDCGYYMVWIGYAKDDAGKTVEPIAYYGFDRGYIEKLNITWSDTERGRGPTGTAIRTGKPAICRNMQTDPAFEPWREDAVKRGYASSIVLPLKSGNKAFGAISIYSRKPDAFDPDDINLLINLADDLAYGITNIRLTESEHKALKVIRESEEKYRLLFEEMVEGFALHEIILDERGHPCDYKFISVNPAFEKQTGLKAENVIGKTAHEVFPNFENYWVENYGKVAIEGCSLEFENYAADLNSYFRVSAFSPKKRYFATIFENITQRIAAEKELQNTKNYLENLINYANAPIIVWNTQTEIQLFNHAFERLTGYSSSEVMGKKPDFLFPESSLRDSIKKIKNTLTRNWETIEIPILTKDKQVKTVLWNSANIYEEDNKSILSTIAQGHDITARIHAELEVRSAKDKLDLALQNANIGIWTWDLTNDRFDWDERIGKMFGLDSAPENNKFEDFEKYIYEEDLPHFNRAIKRALSEDMSLDTIFRTRQNSGEFRYIDAKARVEKDAAGKAFKITGVCLDITAMQKTTEKTLFSLNEDLLRSNRELEQFAYVASHDLQEPLRMVSSFTQLLAARYRDKLDKQAQEFIGFAVDGAQRMQRLINDLLQYSRIKTKGKNLSAIDMNDVLRQTLHNLSIKIKEKKAVISIHPLPAVFADEGQMVQLFQNLVENGLKFCEKIPKIDISASEEDDFLRFSVKDNGIGIEPQYFERIFQIFQRLHLREEYGGTGIGLAICKRIVERHGGKIWVESKNGSGTAFHFTIKKA